LDESDEFDNNRDITATDVRKKVDAKCKGWDHMPNDEIEDILNSQTDHAKSKNTKKKGSRNTTFRKKSTEENFEEFEGELGSIINEETFRSTKIGFRATNKREFSEKFKNIEIDTKIGEGGEGEV